MNNATTLIIKEIFNMEDCIVVGLYKDYQIFFDRLTCKYYTWNRAKKHTSVNLELLKKKIDSFKVK